MLQIIRLKPKPAGKDRAQSSTPSASQLAGEWVDFKHNRAQTINLADLQLHHIAYPAIAYPAAGATGEWQKVTDFTGSLPSGWVVRVHSGAGTDTSIIFPQDREGADFHIFTGSNRYVWNNDRSDCAGLWEPHGKRWLDSAGYDPYPPEGQILLRVGNKLVPSGARVH